MGPEVGTGPPDDPVPDRIDFRRLVERAPAPCFETDASGLCVYVNRAWTELSGLSFEASLGLGWMDALVPGDAEAIRESRQAAIAAGEAYEQHYRIALADGGMRHLHVQTEPLLSGDTLLGWLGWVEDETPRRELLEAVAERDAMLAAVFDQAASGLLVLDVDGRIVRVNDQLCTWVGRSADELMGLNGRMLVVPEELSSARRRMEAALAGETLEPAQRTVVAADGSRLPMWATVGQIRDENGTSRFLVITLTEFAGRVEHEEHLVHLATHDPLTGLPNRRAVERWVADSPARAAVVVDLDGFKALNDRFGHAAGDHALVQVADRLRRCVRSSDLLCRVGGDEFLVLLREPTEGTVDALTARIAAELEAPFLVEGQEVALGASVGVAEGEGSANELAVAADADLYRNKRRR